MVEIVQTQSGTDEANQPAPQAPENVTQTHMGTVDPVEPTVPPTEDKFGGDYGKLMESYKALETKLGTPPAAPEAPPTGDPAAPVGNQPNDFTSYETEFANDGALSQKSYDELGTKGYSKEMVDQYIAGATAQSDKAKAELLVVAGSQEAFDSMKGWAEANYPDDKLEAYNTAIDSGDSARAAMAMSALKADYAGAKGSDGNLLTGKPGQVAVEKFESHAQVTEAMNDPRYDKDPAYRDQVYKRLMASDSVMSSGSF